MTTDHDWITTTVTADLLRGALDELAFTTEGAFAWFTYAFAWFTYAVA
ncbi:hypothetical protein [Streptomyces sp. NPDC090798]